jgi:hypothetical protein
LAEIFDAVTLAPISDTSTPLLEDILLQGVDSSTSTTSTTVPSEKYVEQPDREEIEDVEEQNNETLRKKTKKSGAKAKSESTKKSSLLKSLVTDYSRDERAKKNRRGRKWSNLSKSRSKKKN